MNIEAKIETAEYEYCDHNLEENILEYLAANLRSVEGFDEAQFRKNRKQEWSKVGKILDQATRHRRGGGGRLCTNKNFLAEIDKVPALVNKLANILGRLSKVDDNWRR